MAKRPSVAVFDCETGTYVERPMNDAELEVRKTDAADAPARALTRIRSERDARLAASDWTQSPDAPLSDQERKRWATYRQKLRDLPAATKDPLAPKWPEPPTGGAARTRDG